MSLSRADVYLEISGSDRTTSSDGSYMHVSPSPSAPLQTQNQIQIQIPPLVSISVERLKYLEYLESNISSIVDSAVQEYKKRQNNVMKKKWVKNKENKVQARSPSPKVE